ncbi:ferredoxin [Kineococcus radiotolerans]|uniref:Ferredoxin n=1 Tax=Kineococcus radiotolerans (strain ATCC BAA-149 / DSM 14245 / SRS30216) TaxID=266940 RepID=A6WB09_KINRD|nr:ferredoxin [Kineococcus radiotolerans]ABS03998.1 putative ferredoxin [Kineococcus radiotolerans SRS30216 = ATCC BAA-149]
MRVTTETDRCVAAGVCVVAAPAVFDQDDEEGLVVVLDADPGEEQRRAVEDAAARCPARVIHVSGAS